MREWIHRSCKLCCVWISRRCLLRIWMSGRMYRSHNNGLQCCWCWRYCNDLGLQPHRCDMREWICIFVLVLEVPTSASGCHPTVSYTACAFYRCWRYCKDLSAFTPQERSACGTVSYTVCGQKLSVRISAVQSAVQCSTVCSIPKTWGGW